jgi:ankyrin repeat protein
MPALGQGQSMKLHKAAGTGDLKKVRELLAAGTPIDERDEEGVTPLMIAANFDQLNVFRALLEGGADPNATDIRGQSVLHYAATFGAPRLVQALLEKKPAVNARDGLGETPLMAALTPKVMQLLLEAGADVNIRRNDGLTVLDLHERAQKFDGRTKVSKAVQLLRAAGGGHAPGAAPAGSVAPLRLPAPGTGPLCSPSAEDVQAFLTAAQTDDVARLRALLEAGMPVEVRGEHGQTALHFAALRSCLGAVQVLLAAGAERNARDAYGHTALHVAAQEGKIAVLHTLLQAGFDVNAGSGTRSTPLMVAAVQGAVQAAEVLLAAGAAVNIRNEQGQTALSVTRSREMKAFLREAGADDQSAEPLPRTPTEALLQAADDGDVAKVRELLAAGVPVDGYVRYRLTPLRGAVALGHLEVAQVLLEAGADLHTRDDDGGTLLHAAAWSGNGAVVRFLLQRGLDVNAATKSGRTPLMAAAEEGHLEAARALLEAGADLNARGSSGPQRNKTAVEYVRQIEDRPRRRAMLELLTGTAGAADPVEAVYQAVEGFAAAARQPRFQAMLEVLAGVCDKPPAPSKKCPGAYVCARPNAARLTQRYEGEAALEEALAATESANGRAQLLLDRLRAEVRTADFHLIEPEANQSARTAKLLLFPTADKYAVVAARETDGANYGLATQDIIAWLQEMEKENPFVLTGCGHDFLAGEFVRPVVNAGPLAARMCAFCPDLLDGEVVESPEQVAEQLQEYQGFFFWWD